MKELSLTNLYYSSSQRLFKTMVNIYDGAFLQKHLTALIR